MTLQQIDIEYFQNHQKSTLPLSDGVNCISGDSDNGKTAILRGEYLLINNRPSGYEYKPWNATKKTITTVRNTFDDGVVERRKSDKIDEYILTLNGQEPQVFSSLNRQVPDEIRKFINLKDYNFQEQQDGNGVKKSFFISESPSERARMLNDISGLGIIDSSLANVNSLIRENTAKQKQLDADIESLTVKINNISFVDEAETILVQVEEAFTENEHLGKVNTALQQYVEEATQVAEDIETLHSFLEAKNECVIVKKDIVELDKIEKQNVFLIEYAQEMQQTQETVAKCREKLKYTEELQRLKGLIALYEDEETKGVRLKEFIKDFSEIEETISLTKDWLRCKKEYNTLSDLIFSHGIIESDISEMNSWIVAVGENRKDISTRKKKTVELREKKTMYLKSLGQCPLCGGKI